MNRQTPEIVVIAHDLRSNYNVGSILRTCDGLGVAKFVATGTTPFPRTKDDTRLPHIAERASKQISKTALGAEESVKIENGEIGSVIEDLKSKGYSVYALEQTPESKDIKSFKAKSPCAIILGNEPNGLPINVIELCDNSIEIPMKGSKESFNVGVACAIALWQLNT